jgi:hypothetical protein
MDAATIINGLKYASKTGIITRQQYDTIRGQAVNGDLNGAEKGLKKLLKRGISYG